MLKNLVESRTYNIVIAFVGLKFKFSLIFCFIFLYFFVACSFEKSRILKKNYFLLIYIDFLLILCYNYEVKSLEGSFGIL